LACDLWRYLVLDLWRYSVPMTRVLRAASTTSVVMTLSSLI